MNASKLFESVYGYGKNSRNMMTPDLIKYYHHNNTWAIELSSGTAPFSKAPIYGITVVRKHGKKARSCSCLSKMFYDRQEAESYVHGALKDKMRVYDLKAKMHAKLPSMRPSIAARI